MSKRTGTLKRTEAAAIARETLAIIGSGYYTAPEGGRVDVRRLLEACVHGTQSYSPSDSVPEFVSGRHATRIEVTAETTLAAACRLAEAGHRVCALNFASARNPGGGFLNGSKAQEESLARSSGLYASIRENPMYLYHRDRSDALYTHYAIYSPDVPVWMDDHGDLLNKPWECSFITSPAVNAGVVLSRDESRGDEIRQAMWERTLKVLGIAAAQGHVAIVLGAWGCGVFRNDPETVAELFSLALRENFQGAFRQIVFAVYDRDPSGPTRQAFENRFGKRGSSAESAH